MTANPAFYKTFNLAPSDLEGRSLDDLLPGATWAPPLRTVFAPIVSGEGEVESVEAVCTLRSGEVVVLLLNARRICAPGLPEMVLVEPRDLTRERLAEFRIQVLNDALLAHVATVDAVNKELESYSHSVSHDLRTPLRFVNRIAHLLLHEPGARLSKKAAEQVTMILQATDEMARLIENLLVFSQVSRKPLRKRRMDLRRLFQDVVKELQHAQGGFVVEIDIQELVPCLGDRTLLKEVVLNLLTNALKFTRRRESARITVGYTGTEDEPVYFVRDNGVGFDMKDAGSLFVPFHRLHRSSDFEGTGIGLALVKRIIERHGGRIWAESEVDKGAAFFFTLGKQPSELDATTTKDPNQ